nr:DUF4384 domain-containing protein [Acidobacteriota bacterium]
DLPLQAEEAIIKALAFDPAQRYTRAKDLGDQLARALTSTDAFSTNATAGAASAAVPTVPTPSPATSESPAYGTMTTHSARTEVAADIAAPSTTEAKPKPSAAKYAIAAVAAIVVIGLVIWLAIGSGKPEKPPVIVPTRELTISSRVQQKGKPPLDVPGDVIFSPGDQLRLTFNSPQEGFLYIVSESPKTKNGLPVYNFLFPEPERVTAGAPSLKAGRPLYIPSEQPPWLLIDNEKGTETLWLIWSDHSISEFESARKWLNQKDRGEIKDTGEIRAIQQFIDKYFLEAKPKVDPGEGQKTLKGGKDGLLVYPLKLAHT